MVSRNYLVKSFLIFITLFSLLSEAQVNKAYKTMLNNKNSKSEEGLMKMGADKYLASALASYGYNDTTIIRLRGIGVDLLNIKYHLPWNVKIWTALSDCIIIGTVSKIEHPFKENFWYHTLVFVKVEKFLRNDYNLPIGEIPILQVSGWTDSGKKYTKYGEDTLGIGEHVLLFLSASAVFEFAKNNHLNDLYNQLVNDKNIKFRVEAKYLIENGNVVRKDRVRSIAEVTNDIDTVLNVINRKIVKTKVNFF